MGLNPTANKKTYILTTNICW